MIVCPYGKKIEYFVAIADDERGRPVILTGESYFRCQRCVDAIVIKWEEHNRGKLHPYRIAKVKVNVSVDTKKEFIRRASPQLFEQFPWWLPKTDIQAATKDLKKK